MKEKIFELSKEGYRENFNETFFSLGGYQEAFGSKIAGMHKYKMRTFNESEEFNGLFIGNPTILFSHFVSVNIMHTFHDDWLPLLFTIVGTEEFVEEGIAKRLLISFNDYGTRFEEIFNWLGKYFNVNKLIETLKMESVDNITHLCFADGLIGLSSSSQWYQYGMIKPEGPVPDLNKEIAGKNIKEAVKWIKNGLGLTTVTVAETNRVPEAVTDRVTESETDRVSETVTVAPPSPSPSPPSPPSSPSPTLSSPKTITIITRK